MPWAGLSIAYSKPFIPLHSVAFQIDTQARPLITQLLKNIQDPVTKGVAKHAYCIDLAFYFCKSKLGQCQLVLLVITEFVQCTNPDTNLDPNAYCNLPIAPSPVGPCTKYNVCCTGHRQHLLANVTYIVYFSQVCKSMKFMSTWFSRVFVSRVISWGLGMVYV